MADQQLHMDNNFLEKNKTIIFGGVLLIVAIAAFAFFSGGASGKKNALAAEEMYQAQFYFERDSFALALNGVQTAGVTPVSGFLQIIENYSGTESANLAHYYAGISLLNLGQFDQAVTFLNKYNAKDFYTKNMALIAMGDAKSELQDMEGAKAAYETVANAKKDEAITPYALHKLAALVEHQGNKEAAKTYLEKIKKEYSAYAEAALIDQDLIRITGTY